MKVDAESFLNVLAQRRSCSNVGSKAPSDQELERLLPAVAQVANHGNVDCYRFHTIRGKDRKALGKALNKALGRKGVNRKPMKAPLLIAVIASPKKKGGVPRWEQMGTATGAAHFMSAALWASGWGVLWRTGKWTEAKAVRKFHGVKKDEELLGWLYVGNPKKALHTGGKARKIRQGLITPLP